MGTRGQARPVALVAALCWTVGPQPCLADETALHRFAAAAELLGTYSVVIDAHETLGERSQDYRFRYVHRARGPARLEVLEGPGTGGTLEAAGDGRVSASQRGVPVLKWNGTAGDPAVTTLRGNGLPNADLAALARCLTARTSGVEEQAGPVVDGDATRALVVRSPACPQDPPADRALTLEVIDLSERTGLPVLRKRYAGREIVERWSLHHYHF